MKNLEQAIEAVRENNEINNGSWGEWESADEIAEAYELELSNSDKKYLTVFIEKNYCHLNTKQSYDVRNSFNCDGTFWS